MSTRLLDQQSVSIEWCARVCVCVYVHVAINYPMIYNVQSCSSSLKKYVFLSALSKTLKFFHGTVYISLVSILMVIGPEWNLSWL